MIAQLIETWQIHNRINLYLLDGINHDEYLKDKTNNKGRAVGQQFAHIHNVRLMWLRESAPDLLSEVQKIEREDDLSISFLKENLHQSGLKVQELLKRGFAENKIKGFKPHPTAFLGYLIAHESHHRGQVLVSLKTCEHPVNQKIGFGLWQWGTK